MMAMVDVVSLLPTGGPMAQVRGLGPKVGSRLVTLALFCIHRVNRVYGGRPCSDFMDMLWRLINCCIIITIIMPFYSTMFDGVVCWFGV